MEDHQTPDTRWAAVLQYLASEVPPLMESGENWQVTLHGGAGGDVIVEVLRKATIVRRPRVRHAR